MQPLWVICSSQVFPDVQPEIPKLYCVASVPCLHFLLVAGGGWTLWPWYCPPGIPSLLPAGHPSCCSQLHVKLLIAALSLVVHFSSSRTSASKGDCCGRRCLKSGCAALCPSPHLHCYQWWNASLSSGQVWFACGKSVLAIPLSCKYLGLNSNGQCSFVPLGTAVEVN